MSVSTNGQLCYGILFEKGYEFPWDSDKWDGEIAHWWLYEVCGYENPFELFNGQGGYIDGKTPTEEMVDEYYGARHTFRKAHPLPVELVNYCSCDDPMYILAVSDRVKTAYSGQVREITQEGLANLEWGFDILTQFCQEYGIETDETPKLWLSSSWC